MRVLILFDESTHIVWLEYLRLHIRVRCLFGFANPQGQGSFLYNADAFSKEILAFTLNVSFFVILNGMIFADNEGQKPKFFLIIRMTKLNNQKIKAVFFDMDGVLYDSMPAHSAAWVRAMTQFDLNFTINDCYLNEGRTGDDTINQFVQQQFGRKATRKEMDEIYALKTAYFEQSGGAQPMPFANDLLQKIKSERRQIVLVTGSGQASLLDNLNKDFPSIFNNDNTVTAFDVTRGKPDPEPYLLALKKSGREPHEAIVIENAPLGIQSAKAAGISVIAVNTGTLENKILYDCGAKIVLASMKELFDKWDELEKIIF